MVAGVGSGARAGRGVAGVAERSITDERPLQRLGRLVGAWLGHESIPQMAAAMAYRTVFSIIPLCIIGLVVLQRFVNKEKTVESLFERFLEVVGLAQIGLDQDQSNIVATKLRELTRSFDSLSFTGIGLISGLTLIYAAISLLVELENAFNRLYGATRGRSLVRRLMQYWLMVSLGPVLLAMSFFVVDRLTGAAGSVAGAWFGYIGAYASSVAITSLLLWVLYLTMPNARVRPTAALYGAVVASVALEAAKFGFQLYLQNAALKSIYGSLALIPVFLLWVYVTWVIVLTGVRVAFLIQHGRRVTLLSRLAGSGNGGRAGDVFIDPAYVAEVAADVARRFATGQPAVLDGIAERAGLSEAATRAALGELARAGLVAPIKDERSGGERWVLCRPAETIAMPDVLRAGFSLAGEQGPRVVLQVRQAQLRAAEGQSLAGQIAGAEAAGGGAWAMPKGEPGSSGDETTPRAVAAVPKGVPGPASVPRV